MTKKTEDLDGALTLLKQEFEDVKKQLFTINEKYEELGKNNEDINKQLVTMSEKYEQLGTNNEECKPKCFVFDKNVFY